MIKEIKKQGGELDRTMSDQKLLLLCDEYGQKTLFWRRKFVGLLPEVARRRLYEKAGCGSIFEFAKKKAGLSENHVRRVLNLERRFVDKPVLKKLLVNGEVSVNKLARVASVATFTNQAFWATQSKLLPNRSLETLVRDEKWKDIKNGESEESSILEKPAGERDVTQTVNNSVHVHTVNFAAEDLGLSHEIVQRLKKLKFLGHDVNKILSELLDEREAKIMEEKQKLAKECDLKAMQSQERGVHSYGEKSVHVHRFSRHIPAKVRRVVVAEFGTKCAVPHCTKSSQLIHHTGRFSVVQSHNPYFLAPLCKEHHDIAHAVDGRFFVEKLRI